MTHGLRSVNLKEKLGSLAAVFNDLRFAWRLVLRQPLLSTAAVLTIAFGVGANTAIVSVLENLLLNPAGLRDADRIAVVRVNVERVRLHDSQTSAVEFKEIQSMADTFSWAAAMEGRYWTAQPEGAPARVVGQAVTPDFFRVFGVYPAIGAFFSPEDRDSVVLSYGYWESQFGGDTSVIGRTLVLDDKLHRIIGVAPADFHFPANAQLWTSLFLEPQRLVQRGYNMNLWVFARLKDGVTMTQAADRVRRYMDGLKSSPEGADLIRSGYGVEIDPVSRFVAGDLRRPLWLLFGAAVVVLLTGCANVAGLLLSRASGRRREIAIRISIGATSTQIVRQLLIESLLLGALGGMGGLLMAAGAMPLIAHLSVPGKQWLLLVGLDHRMLAYGFGLALLSGLLFGLTPAIQLLRDSQVTALARSQRQWLKSALVSAEVAGAFVLVVVTMLLLQSFFAIERIRPGFDPGHLMTAFLLKPKNDPGFLDRLREELRVAPGVESVALAYPLPFSGSELTSGFAIRNRERGPGEPEWHGEGYMISPGYLRSLRIPLLLGRDLAESDTATSTLVCLIDARLAEQFFPNQNPLGQEIAMYKGWARIVGVVGAIRGTSLDGDPRFIVYYPLAQIPFFQQAGVVIRSATPIGNILREAMRRANPTVPIFDVRPMENRIGDSLGIRRVVATLLTIFGAISLLLAVIGLYGMVAQVVAERTNEIGVRMALGARPTRILSQFAAEGIRAGLIGLVCGLIAAVYARHSIAGLLYHAPLSDFAIFLLSGAGVFLVLLTAVWWPARRASRIDPLRALRYE